MNKYKIILRFSDSWCNFKHSGEERLVVAYECRLLRCAVDIQYPEEDAQDNSEDGKQSRRHFSSIILFLNFTIKRTKNIFSLFLRLTTQLLPIIFCMLLSRASRPARNGRGVSLPIFFYRINYFSLVYNIFLFQTNYKMLI